MGGMNTDWLAQLAPAHAPPAPGWWPPAPGWWGLALSVLLLAGGLVYWLRRASRQPRRIALRELARLEQGSGDDVQLARELEHLMRRYALAVHGREAVAGLSCEDWLAFIVAHGGASLSGETGRNLLRAAYGSPGSADRAGWLNGAREFMRSRR
jgi:hypothetical protein